MKIAYSAPRSLEIAGTVERLDQARRAVIATAEDGEPRILEGAPHDPRPYERSLRLLRLARGEGGVRVAVVGDEVHVRGSSEALRAFASFFAFERGRAGEAHSHVEPFEGSDAWVHRDSLPLVISAQA